MKKNPEIDKIEILIKNDNSDENYKKCKIVDSAEESTVVEKLEPLGKYSFKVKVKYKNGMRSKGNETSVTIKHKSVVWDKVDGVDILVYLPEGYKDEDERYPVMYMFDGQKYIFYKFCPD